MPSTDPSEGFSGLRQWSEPLIFDRLHVAYRALIAEPGQARELTRQHARVWREALVQSLAPCLLTLDHLAEVDAEIMTELLDVVIARYNRSHRTARAYHLALMQLAGRLGPARVAA
jgi:hypothetical protein